MISVTVAVVPRVTEVSGCVAGAITSGDFQAVGERFHEDGIAEFRADTQTRIANLADKTAIPAQQLDPLFFAKTHFAQAILDFRRSCKAFDTNDRTGLHAAQRAERRLGTLALPDDAWMDWLGHWISE